jgi:F-type H+-transporting ATPase subunit epsilon
MAINKSIKFEIVTPERVVLKKDIKQITAPTQSGEITVLPEHIPLVSILKPGVIELQTIDDQLELISVSGGFIEVLRDKVVILADTAERAEELDEDRIIIAKKAALEAKEKALTDDHYDLSAVAVRLEIEMARERAISKWRNLRRR